MYRDAALYWNEPPPKCPHVFDLRSRRKPAHGPRATLNLIVEGRFFACERLRGERPEVSEQENRWIELFSIAVVGRGIGFFHIGLRIAAVDMG